MLRWPQHRVSMMLIGWSKDIIMPIVKCATSLFFVIFVAKFIIDFFFVRLIVEGETLPENRRKATELPTKFFRL